ncbi:MAG: transposase [Anaerolineae bacterium]|nr:transposase [Anaerolineae bacterium]
MPFDPDRHHRRSIRLRGFDYRDGRADFVTLCTLRRQCLFGDVIDGEMVLNALGEIVRDEWLYTAVVRPTVTLDAFVVMPNHLHGIIDLDNSPGATRRRATRRVAPTDDMQDSAARPRGPDAGSLSAIIGQFKSAATRRLVAADLLEGSPWQRNYYEHIIRNRREYDQICAYIVHNPAHWTDDAERRRRLKPVG